MIEHWPSTRLSGFKSHHWEKKMLELGNNVSVQPYCEFS